MFASKSLFVFVSLLSIEARGDTPFVTPAPNGPYRIEGNRIVDKDGKPYLIRGTRLTALTLNAETYGPLSATTLVTVRQRLNMNAVRIPVNSTEYTANAAYRTRLDRLVRLANQFELLAILETTGEGHTRFWTSVAAQFADNPNVFFAPLSIRWAEAMRRAGARQPMVVDVPRRGFLYQLSPSYAAMKSDADRQRQVGRVAADFPVLVDGLDPKLDRGSNECASFPHDPSEAYQLVEANLRYFDTSSVSWTISSFTAGKLVTGYRYLNATKLDAGWVCGHPAAQPAGIGMVLLAHLWGTEPLRLFTVSENRGGMVIARGAISTAYGPIFSDETLVAHGPPLPTRLGNVSIRITDSRGVARLAPLLHAGAGWAFISFVIPEECAVGPAEVSVVRTDGSVTKSRVLIADVVPALFSVPPDGRSAAAGLVTQREAGEPDRTFPAWECVREVCRATPIPLSTAAATSMRIHGTGFRFAGQHAEVHVMAGGISVPVLSVGAGTEPGSDEVTISLPDALQGSGETDLYLTVNGQVSNVVQINCGSRSFPAPRIPRDNPLTIEKAQLGRYLFYDKRMSVNGGTACGTCHRQELAFTDGLGRAEGATGELHSRGAMSLVNAAWNRTFNWADQSVRSLEEQALKPMMSTNPLELGFAAVEQRFLNFARADPVYGALFPAAFPKSADPWTTDNITKALASFERTIVSRDSPWDRFHFGGDESAISESAKRGEVLFFLEAGPSCFRCHGGFNFSDSVVLEGEETASAQFHNTGLYNLAGNLSFPPGGRGLYEASKLESDVGRFKAPTLRNIAVTAPYMHDGSAATLGDVLDHYASGGRTIAKGALAGVGHDNPLKDKLIHGFQMTARNKADLIAFLESLTDRSLLADPALSNPWLTASPSPRVATP